MATVDPVLVANHTSRPRKTTRRDDDGIVGARARQNDDELVAAEPGEDVGAS